MLTMHEEEGTNKEEDTSRKLEECCKERENINGGSVINRLEGEFYVQIRA